MALTEMSSLPLEICQKILKTRTRIIWGKYQEIKHVEWQSVHKELLNQGLYLGNDNNVGYLPPRMRMLQIRNVYRRWTRETMPGLTRWDLQWFHNDPLCILSWVAMDTMIPIQIFIASFHDRQYIYK